MRLYFFYKIANKCDKGIEIALLHFVTMK